MTWGTAAQPNLAPYQPTGWSSSIVVTNSPTGTTDTTVTAGQTAYINFAVTNLGSADATTSFRIKLALDSTVIGYFTAATLAKSTYIVPNPVPSFTVPSGSHAITLTVDVDGSVAESNEADNVASRSFTWGSGTTTLVSDDFEGSFTAATGGKWDLYTAQGARNDVSWAKTTCDKYSGTASADSVRGGSAGSTLSCTANYVNTVGTVLDYHDWISVQGKTAPKLRFKIRGRSNPVKDSSGNFRDYFGVFIQPDGASSPQGYVWSGDLTASWNQIELDLANWWSLGDLRGYARFDLFFYFESASGSPAGYGFRVDDFQIVASSGTEQGSAVAGERETPLGFLMNPIPTEAVGGGESMPMQMEIPAFARRRE